MTESLSTTSLDASGVEVARYVIGDMFWVKVGHHPYWPCMIFPFPDEPQLYFKEYKTTMKYHVQFFGPNERGWVTWKSLIPFEGLSKFKEFQEQEINHAKNPKQMQLQFAVAPRVLNSWEHSVQIAEDALLMNRIDRVKMYGQGPLNIIVESVQASSAADISTTESSKSSCKENRNHENKSKRAKKRLHSEMASENEVTELKKRSIESEEKKEPSNPPAKRAKITVKPFEFTKLRFDPKVPYKPAFCVSCVDTVARSDDPFLFCAGSCGNMFHQSCMLPYPGEGEDMDSTFPTETLNSKIDIQKSTVFKCSDCHNSVTRCFVCQEEGVLVNSAPLIKEILGHISKNEYSPKDDYSHANSLIPCVGKRCSRLYHAFCLFRHTCHSCVLDNPGAVRQSNRHVTCLLCPAAYHLGDWCIPAGSFELSPHHIICPRHLTDPQSALQKLLAKRFPDLSDNISERDNVESSTSDASSSAFGKKKMNKVSKPISEPEDAIYEPINVSWCFICTKGGQIICCEQCPASYHPQCLKLEEVPTESFICEPCHHGMFPRYGQLVWAKVNNYRWWPGEIVRERNVPNNITNMVHYPGEFAIRFFGTDDYYWTTKGRCFAFEEGDHLEKKRRKVDDSEQGRRLEESYQKALQISGEAFALRKTRSDLLLVIGKNPDQYKHIKTNFPIGNVRTIRPFGEPEIAVCDCKVTDTDPCGPSSNCINRELKFECHPSYCSNGDQCLNQRFTLRKYPAQEPFKTEARGWGLKTLEDIQQGQFVNEYVGDLIDNEESDRRLRVMSENNITNYYMMILDSQRVIDAGPKGNYSRFMNHSCSPNLRAEKWTVNSDTRVGLFAIRDISSGEELTFNYNFVTKGQERMKCYCGTSNCSGFIGIPPEEETSKSNNTSGNARRRRVTIKKEKTISVLEEVEEENNISTELPHEDVCFRCNEKGKLLECKKKNCTKVYHVHCAGLSQSTQIDNWFCPWHFCEICGRTALLNCNECPSSFCIHHWLGNVCLTPNKRLVCMRHKAWLESLQLSPIIISKKEDLSLLLEEDPSLYNPSSSEIP